MSGDRPTSDPVGVALHVPVLREEVIRAIDPRTGGKYIDATCGLGGHAEALLEASSPDGRLLAIDRDPKAIEHAKRRLGRFGDRATFVEGRFSDVAEIASRAGYKPADGLVADLGVSSLQLDDPSRGFSFRGKGPLDMRMGPREPETARDLLHSVDAEELAGLLRELGEVDRPRRIARAILEARDEGRLETTEDLARAVEKVSGPPPRGRRRIHPATRVFQALRIEVNCELEELGTLLAALPDLIAPGGRVAIITFHSLEDRMVKRSFRGETASHVPGHEAAGTRDRTRPMVAVHKRPIEPAEAEIEHNPRARSAKLRVAQREAHTR